MNRITEMTDTHIEIDTEDNRIKCIKKDKLFLVEVVQGDAASMLFFQASDGRCVVNFWDNDYEDGREKAWEDALKHYKIIKNWWMDIVEKLPTLEELGLSPRILHCLLGENIQTTEELLTKTYKYIRGTPHLGKKSGDELLEKLDSFGLSLKKES